jgi:hypothetical protein
VTVVVNLGRDAVSATVAICEIAGTGDVILSSYPDPPSASKMTRGVVLRPWEAIVYRSTPRSSP